MIRELLLLTALSVSFPAFCVASPTNGGQWIASKSGCKLWDPAPEENEAVEWSGDCKDGFSDGHGSETWFKGAVRGNVVEGNAVSGKLVGEVKTHYINGDVYIGNLSPYDGNRDGHGEMMYSIGSRYIGNWSHGIREGYGEYYTKDGGWYKGNWHANKFNGHGEYRYNDGRLHVGQFLDGNKDGIGELTWVDGTRYKGKWSDGQPSGPGYYFDAHGAVIREINNGSVPLIRESGVFKVPVEINGAIKLNFVIDSGAADVAIPADVVLVMIRSGSLNDKDFIGSQTYVQADGSQIPSATFLIKSLRVGGVLLNNVTGSVSNINGQLLLGQSFLSRVKYWKIDSEHGFLEISQ